MTVARAIENETGPAVKTVRLITARRLKALRASLRWWKQQVYYQASHGGAAKLTETTPFSERTCLLWVDSREREIAEIRAALRAGRAS